VQSEKNYVLCGTTAGFNLAEMLQWNKYKAKLTDLHNYQSDLYRGMPYSSALYCANLPSLQQRCDQQACKFFKSILAPDSCLHSLLPAARDKNLIARLRAARTFTALASRTKCYQSFINFGLLHYQ